MTVKKHFVYYVESYNDDGEDDSIIIASCKDMTILFNENRKYHNVFDFVQNIILPNEYKYGIHYCDQTTNFTQFENYTICYVVFLNNDKTISKSFDNWQHERFKIISPACDLTFDSTIVMHDGIAVNKSMIINECLHQTNYSFPFETTDGYVIGDYCYLINNAQIMNIQHHARVKQTLCLDDFCYTTSFRDTISEHAVHIMLFDKLSYGSHQVLTIEKAYYDTVTYNSYCFYDVAAIVSVTDERIYFKNESDYVLYLVNAN